VWPAELEAVDEGVAGDDFDPVLQPMMVAPATAIVSGTPTARLTNLLMDVSFRPRLCQRKR
jgi:hypothetical protein